MLKCIREVSNSAVLLTTCVYIEIGLYRNISYRTSLETLCSLGKVSPNLVLILPKSPLSCHVLRQKIKMYMFLKEFTPKKLQRQPQNYHLLPLTKKKLKTIRKKIQSTVAPMVRAPSQLLGTPVGSDVHLKCQIEASPMPVSYWLKASAAKAPSTSSAISSSSSSTMYGGFGGVSQSNGGEIFNHQQTEMLLDG